MIRYSAAAANDSQFLKEVHLPKGSVLVFDRGYYDFATLNRFTADGITWVSRLRKLFSYNILKQNQADDDFAIVSDEHIKLGWRCGIRVTARLIHYRDVESGELYQFISNNFRMKAASIAALDKKRWQIEVLFKRLKQNYPLKYFFRRL